MASSPGVVARPLPAVRLPAPLMLLAWVVAASALQLVRTPGQPAWRVLWAEDGTIFLQQALDKSFPHALATPYAGYLHVVPRLLAELAAPFPLAAAAGVLAASAGAVVALLAAYVWVASASVLTTRRARALLVALFICVPPAVIESRPTSRTSTGMGWSHRSSRSCTGPRAGARPRRRPPSSG